jgi:preprotein translocase subunit SecB
MEKNYKILAEFIKDMSSETPDIQTYLFVKDQISKYHLTININSKALKNQMIEICTTLKYEDKEISEKRSYFEINYATIIKISEEIKDKKILEKLLLCDVQKEIYPRLEKALLNLIHDCGFTDVKFGKKVDFEKLYEEKIN